MMNKAELKALAERVEGLGGPDREIDCLIFEWLNPAHKPEKRGTYYGKPTGEYFDYVGDGEIDIVARAPNFTASLDAAMQLVPEGSELVSIVAINRAPALPSAGIDGGRYISHAATPALALTAACLRALSTQPVIEE